MNSPTRWAAGIVAALAMVATAGCSASPGAGSKTDGVVNNPNEGVTEEAIKLGWMGDETSAGASVNLPVLYGVQAYASYINESGGLFNRQVEIYDEDDEFIADNATVNFKKLTQDEKVLAITNMGGSQITAPLAPSVLKAKVPVVFPAQTITAQQEVPYFFNLIPHFGDQAKVLVAQATADAGAADALDLLVVRLAVPSGEEFEAGVEAALDETGGHHAGTITLEATQSDFTPTVVQVQEALADGATAITFHGSLSIALGFMSALSKAGITDVPIYGIQALTAPGLFEQGPADVVDDVTTVQAVLPANSDAPGAAVIADYIKGTKWEEYAGEPYFVLGWLAAKTIAEAAQSAVEEHDGELTRETLYEALQGITFDAGGLTCPLEFDGDQHYSACVAPMGWDGKRLVAKADFTEFADLLAQG